MDNEAIRVLQVVSTAAITTKRFFIPFARRLREEGYEVTFATGPGEYVDAFRRTGFDVEVLPIRRRLFTLDHLRALRRLYALMRRKQFHIVHTHTPVASALARVAAKMAGVPVVIYHVRTSYVGQSALAKYSFLAVERLLGPLTSFVFTINESDARDFVRYGIVADDRVLCLQSGGTGVDLDTFDPGRIPEEKTAALRRELGLKPHHRVIGFIGRMIAAKGLPDLAEAFRKVAARHPDARLLMIGDVLETARDRETLPEFKRKMRAYGLDEQVLFTGFREDIPELLTLMDFFTLPSRMEPFGMTIAEAAAMGVPAVVTNTRGGRQAVRDKETGLVTDRQDPEALARAFDTLLSDEALLVHLGRNARRRAENVFAENRVVGLELDVYGQLLRGHLQHSE